MSKAEDPLVSQTHKLLVTEGYKLIEDAWQEFGRVTYLHDDDADRDHIKGLARSLHPLGWQTAADKLRTFRHLAAHHEIELEPGGAEVIGHFLHYLKPQQA